MEWGYVEHIGVRVRACSDVDDAGDHAAEEKERENFHIIPRFMSCRSRHATEESKKEQDKVPDKAMQRHGPVRVHESRRNGKRHDAAEETEILKKSRDAAKRPSGAQKRHCQAEIHGDTAELEREVPPVVATIKFDEI